MSIDKSEFIAVFVSEAQERLTELNQAFLKLEKDSRNEKLLGELFRVAHTLKGSAMMMGYHQISDLSHKLTARNLLFHPSTRSFPRPGVGGGQGEEGV